MEEPNRSERSLSASEFEIEVRGVEGKRICQTEYWKVRLYRPWAVWQFSYVEHLLKVGVDVGGTMCPTLPSKRSPHARWHPHCARHELQEQGGNFR